MKEILGIVFWGFVIYFTYSYFTSDSNSSHQYQYSSGNYNSYNSRVSDCSSLEPENPYGSGSGHYAGFEWGERENSCGDNSQSFIEGCEEFQRQDEVFTSCENNK